MSVNSLELWLCGTVVSRLDGKTDSIFIIVSW